MINGSQHIRSIFATAALLGMALPITAQAEKGPVSVSSPQAVKGMQTLIVGAFNVGFIFQSLDKTKATGGMIGAFGGATSVKSELNGVTPAMMQQITDAAYADFVAQLTAHGFTVAPANGMFASPGFTSRVKIMTAPYDANVQIEKSTGKSSYYKPNAIPAMFMLPGDIVSSGMSGIGLAMSAGTNQYAVGEHAKASGQAVVDVVYLIDFSTAKRPGAFSFSGGITVNSGMAVVEDYSKLNLVTPSGKVTSIVLRQPISVEGDFATRENVTKNAGMQKAMNIFGGLAAMRGMGGMKFGKSETYAFTAKSGNYETGAIKAATLTNTLLVDQLTALR